MQYFVSEPASVQRAKIEAAIKGLPSRYSERIDPRFGCVRTVSPSRFTRWTEADRALVESHLVAAGLLFERDGNSFSLVRTPSILTDNWASVYA